MKILSYLLIFLKIFWNPNLVKFMNYLLIVFIKHTFDKINKVIIMND